MPNNCPLFRDDPVKAIPIEHHIAEKIHALTLPRDVSNSRVKDLY